MNTISRPIRLIPQTAQPIEHVVDRLGQPVEFVAAALERDTLGEVAGDDRLGGAVDRIEPALQHPAEQESAGHRDRHDQPEGGGEQRHHALVELFQRLRVGPDDQQPAVGFW